MASGGGGAESGGLGDDNREKLGGVAAAAKENDVIGETQQHLAREKSAAAYQAIEAAAWRGVIAKACA
jgi:hypothetical protein